MTNPNTRLSFLEISKYPKEDKQVCSNIFAHKFLVDNDCNELHVINDFPENYNLPRISQSLRLIVWEPD